MRGLEAVCVCSADLFLSFSPPFFISVDRFLFGSLSFSLAFSFIGCLYSSFSLACMSRATSSTGCPEYAWKIRATD